MQDLLLFFILWFILVPIEGTSRDNSQYGSCVPRDCGNGLNISFPFYIPGLQEPFCGYPGFVLNCRSQDGFPVLRLSETDYVVREIFYENRTLIVSNSAIFSSSNNNNSCLPRIRNTTLDTDRFDYVNVRSLHLLSNCSQRLPASLHRFANNSCEIFYYNWIHWTLALYEGDENLREAMENCGTNVVAPVQMVHDGNASVGTEGVVEILRRGFVMNWTVSNCATCRASGGRCGFDDTSYQFRCFCPDRPHSSSCPAPRKSKIRKILITGGSSVVGLATIILIICSIMKRNDMAFRFLQKKTKNQKDFEIFLKNNQNIALRRYKYFDLKKMTKSFAENLGKGGYGGVYKGQLPDKSLVAVKILNLPKENGQDFMNEVASISRTSHINIVSLVGFCFEGSKRALVYEFMPNGSLEKFAQNAASSSEVGLRWEKLYDIALGVARGLEYLHRGCNTRIIHFDIKPHNILLDKDLNPKISDFGLAKLCPNRSSIVKMSEARGTIGYIAPEIFCRNFGEVSYKSDVYSYGMMVLDIVGMKKKNNLEIDLTSETYFPQYIYKQLEIEDQESGVEGVEVDPDESHLIKRKLIIVGLWCIQTDPRDRPSISRVIEMLEGDLELLQIPPKPYLSSPQRSPPMLSTSESISLLL